MIEKKESTARRFSGGVFRIGDVDRCADRAATGLNGSYDGAIQFLSLCVGHGGIAGWESVTGEKCVLRDQCLVAGS